MSQRAPVPQARNWVSGPSDHQTVHELRASDFRYDRRRGRLADGLVHRTQLCVAASAGEASWRAARGTGTEPPRRSISPANRNRTRAPCPESACAPGRTGGVTDLAPGREEMQRQWCSSADRTSVDGRVTWTRTWTGSGHPKPSEPPSRNSGRAGTCGRFQLCAGSSAAARGYGFRAVPSAGRPRRTPRRMGTSSHPRTSQRSRHIEPGAYGW